AASTSSSSCIKLEFVTRSICFQVDRHVSFSFFFHDPATTEIYTLSLHDALPILVRPLLFGRGAQRLLEDVARQLLGGGGGGRGRSEEHTSELQSRGHLVCRLLLEKKKEIVYVFLKDSNTRDINIEVCGGLCRGET